MNDERYISVDVETSGPIPGDYSMLTLGACSVNDPAVTFYRELKPISDAYIPEALKVSGLSMERLLEEGTEPGEAMADFRTWIEETAAPSTPVMVGFNAAFDWSFVNWYFAHFKHDNPFGIAPIDIKAYYMGLAGTTWADTRSSRLPEEFQIRTERAHNALDDAIAQGVSFVRMLGVQKRGIS